MSKEELRKLLSTMKAGTVAMILDRALTDDGENLLWSNDKERLAFWSLLELIRHGEESYTSE